MDFRIRQKTGADPRVHVAVEYYNEELDHHFMTHKATEIANLDAQSNGITGWVRTGATLPVLAKAGDDTTPICRFYLQPPFGDSHFYGRAAQECAATARDHPEFVLEDAQFFHMVLPTQGACAPGTTPVYRLFNQRRDANHRYVVERTIRDQMVAHGWLAEGDGDDLVAMCAPSDALLHA